jgi:hypothetical protein
MSEKHLQTHQTIFFCIFSVFNSSVITIYRKAGGGILFLRGNYGVEGYYGKIITGYPVLHFQFKT